MKQYIIPVLVLTALLFADKVKSQSSFTSDEAVITWINDIHDFGKIEKDKPVTVAFKFKNESLKPLIITKVESSCGCTVPDYPKKPVKPMGKGEVKATFDAKKVGRFSKSVTVATNTDNRPKVLILKGEVVPPKK